MLGISTMIDKTPKKTTAIVEMIAKIGKWPSRYFKIKSAITTATIIASVAVLKLQKEYATRNATMGPNSQRVLRMAFREITVTVYHAPGKHKVVPVRVKNTIYCGCKI
jgi:hypothetical protein